MPIDLIYDNSVIEEASEWGKCIHAPESVFEVVAGLLFKLATEKPDASQEQWLQRGLVIDFDLQAALFAFATQCLTGDLCIEGGDMRLRQKPDNPCILQQDQGDEWVDVFDYSLCMAPVQEGIQEIIDKGTTDGIISAPPQLLDIMRDFFERYDDTSESYDPDLTVGAEGPGNICEAIREVVNSAIAISKNYKDEESESLSRAALAVSVGVAVVGVLALLVTAGAATPAVVAFFSAYLSAGSLAMASAALGLTAAGLAVWAQGVKDANATLFENPALPGEIACAWYEVLKAEIDVSYTDYQLSPDFEGTEASEDAVTLWGVIAPLVTQQAYYVAFLKAWKRSKEFSSVGISPDCGCENPTYVVRIVDNGFLEYLGPTAGNVSDRYRLYADQSLFYPSANILSDNPAGFYIRAITQVSGEFRSIASQSTTGFYGYNAIDDPENTVSHPLIEHMPHLSIFGVIGQNGGECIWDIEVSYDPPTP